MELLVDGKSECIPLGSHICQFFNKPSEIVPVTAHFLGPGLRNNDKCLLAAGETAIAEIVAAMHAQGVDVATAAARGQWEVITDRELLLLNHRFDPYHLLSQHQTFIARALHDGYENIRISMDMSWLSRDAANGELIMKYEAMSDAVFTFQHLPVAALMHYDCNHLSPHLQGDIRKLHPLAVVGKYLHRNPNYIDSEQYLQKIWNAKRERRTGGPVSRGQQYSRTK